jgi:signal transduction histidine kinase
MRKTILFLALIFFQISFSQNRNQKKVDSLLIAIKTCKVDTTKCSIYNQISNFQLYSNIEQGLLYANKGLALSKKINWQTGIGLSNLNLAKHYSSKGNFVKSDSLLKVAASIFAKISDKYNLANVYNQYGILYANQGKFPDAIDYFFKSLKNFEETNKKSTRVNIANVYQNIANIYSATENFDKSIANYNKAIELFKTIKNQETSTAMNIASKGMVFQKQKKYNEALLALKTAENILTPLKSNAPLSFVQSWLGSVYLSMKNYDKSLEYSNLSIETITQMGDQVLMAATIQNIGYAHLKKGISTNNNSEIELGFNNISKSLALNKASGNLELLLNDYSYLSEYYKHKKDFEKSLEAYTNFSICNDSIFNTKNKQSLQNLVDERTILLNNKEILINKTNLQNKEKQKLYLLAGIGLLAIIGGLLFYQSRNRQKINQKLQVLNADLDQANKTKARFFSILNHDLRSPVYNLMHFLQLQKESPELLDEVSKNEIETQTMTSVENLLMSMEDMLLWSKGQMEHFKPKLENTLVSKVFSDTQKHFSSEQKIQFVFENLENIKIFTDENYLKTILRNLTGNAIKALANSKKPTIIWKAWQTNDKKFLSITDNGIGATNENFKALYDDTEVIGIESGLGLHLIRDLAKAIDCVIEVDSKLNKGTTFTLKLN